MYMSGSVVDKKALQALALCVHSRRKMSIAVSSFYPVRGLRNLTKRVVTNLSRSKTQMCMKNPPKLSQLFRISVAAITLLGIPTALRAQTLVYSEDFETDHTLDGSWVINTIGGYNPANLFFDYSSVGIPAAPNSGGTTHGLKLQANLDPAVAVFPSGVSASPSGFSITANFEMTWDWWLNYNGPLNGGGSGSTQIGGAGFGTAGTSAQVAGGPIDSLFVGASGDGSGTSADYRVYTPAAPTSHGDLSGVYAAGKVAGSRNNSSTYYQSTFLPQSATNNCPQQLVLYPQQTGQTEGGSAGMKWRSVRLRKVGTIITYTMDNLLIATIDTATNGTFGGNNIIFGQFDINAGASTDINATNLAFSLVDNIRITNFNNVVTISNSIPTAKEAGQVAAEFIFQRTEAGVPLTINYTVSGTAQNGVDYTNALGGALGGSITFDAAAFSTNLTIVPIDDNVAEAVETVTVSITPALEYVGAGGATAVIVDNEPATVAITNISTQMYERTNDYAVFQVSRLGDTGAVFSVNLSFTGSATIGTDYYTNTTVDFDAGYLTTNITVYPIVDGTYEGNETVTVGVGAGSYAVGSPASASITLVDADAAPETVLFSENFDADHSANWSVLAAGFDGVPDYSADFNFAYPGFGIPEAPHGGGNGLFLTANKDGVAAAAAVNVYPAGAQTFSGNYALRFDLFASVPIPSGSATEAVIAGINHSGTKTNWTRSGGVPAAWVFDGLFASMTVEAGSTPVYGLYSTPTTAGNIPTLVASQSSTPLANVLKANPFGVSGAVGNSNNPSGFFATPTWVDVEIAQIGKVVSLKLNKTQVYSYTNNGSFTSGKIMLGYMDSFDSIGNSQSYAIIDNVRVVSLAAPVISQIAITGGNVQVDFAANSGDVVAQFTLQSATSPGGPFTDVASTITSLGSGNFRSTVTYNSAVTPKFYRIGRAY